MEVIWGEEEMILLEERARFLELNRWRSVEIYYFSVGWLVGVYISTTDFQHALAVKSDMIVVFNVSFAYDRSIRRISQITY